MPGFFDSLPSPPRQGFFGESEPPPTGTTLEDEGGFELGPAVVGGAALLSGAVLARQPGAFGKLLKGANAVRQQLMLSGLALPKSLLGNTGAAIASSMERQSLGPLKSFFSRETLRDASAAYKAGGHVGPTPGLTLPGPNPGKAMGAMDVASQKALVRGGMSADEAQAAVFQTPLGQNMGKLGDVLESPEAGYLVPFRRTPFNQFFEGFKTVKESGPAAQVRGVATHPGTFNAYATAGAVHGATTSDEQYPTSIPLATALSAKYGLPYALAAIAARAISGGSGGGGVAGSILPVSEYGIEQSLSDPLRPFTKPAASRFFE